MTATCKQTIALDAGHRMANMLLYLCTARYLLANFMLWVSWKRGPGWWIKIGPTVMYLVTLTNYILLPLGGFVFFGMHWSMMQDSVYGLYMDCVCIMWATQMIYYFYIIRPYVYFNALAYLASRKLEIERKEQAELSNNQDATVDFPN